MAESRSMSVLFALSLAGERGTHQFYNISAEEVVALMRAPAHASFTAQLVRTETVWTGPTGAWRGELRRRPWLMRFLARAWAEFKADPDPDLDVGVW
jgi:hypothetical protein